MDDADQQLADLVDLADRIEELETELEEVKTSYGSRVAELENDVAVLREALGTVEGTARDALRSTR